jgi:hypothetical protein
MQRGRPRFRALVAASIIFAVTSADPSAGQERAVDGDPRIVQTDVFNPDGRHRRVVFNADGYAMSDIVSPGRPDEDTTLYERTTKTNKVTRITVKCLGPTGGAAGGTAVLADGDTEGAVRGRLRSQCASA